MLAVSMLFTVLVVLAVGLAVKGGLLAGWMTDRRQDQELAELKKRVDILTEILIESDLLDKVKFDRVLRLRGGPTDQDG